MQSGEIDEPTKEFVIQAVIETLDQLPVELQRRLRFTLNLRSPVNHTIPGGM